MEKGLPGYACMIIRKWHKNSKGGYQKFISVYKNSKWISSITKQKFEELKTAPVKRPDQKKYYKTSGSRKSRNVNRIYMTLWKKNKSEIGAKGVELVKEILNALSKNSTGTIELVEYTNPDVVEIRQYSH